MRAQPDLPATVPGDLQHVKGASIAFLRIFLGVMWLFEVTVGHNWKVGSFTSGANPRWMGPGAGEGVREEAAKAIDDGTYGWFAWLFEAVIIPNALFLAYAVILLQVVLGVAFILGVAVRPLALAAVAMDVSIFMLGNSRIPPFFTAMHLFAYFSGAGRYYGLDGWILERTSGARGAAARTARWLIELPVFRRVDLPGAVAAFALVALYFLLTLPTRETARFQHVALDLAALSALLSLGLYAAHRYGDRVATLASTLRIFVGFKFLHEIWARPAPGVNALPGFADGEAQGAVFQLVVDHHWGLFAWLTEKLVLPQVGLWVVILGAVQLAVGLALVLGYRTRTFGLLGLAFLGVLIVFGMTRYPPFVFGLLIPVVALDGGRVLSFDALRRAGRRPAFGLPIPRAALPLLVALAAINGAAAAITSFGMGVVPDAYVTSMPAMTTAFVAIFSALLAFVGWLQLHPELDHSGGAAPGDALVSGGASPDFGDAGRRVSAPIARTEG